MVIGENKNTSIKSSNFNLGLSKSYHLSIEVQKSYISYCILDIENLNYVLLEHVNYKHEQSNSFSIFLTSLINNNDILKASYSSISIAFSSFPSTIIPLELFEEKNKRKVLEFNTDNIGEIFTNTIFYHNAKIIYSVPKEITTIFNTFFPDAHYNCMQNVIIHQYSQYEKKGDHIYINVNKQHYSIVVFKNRKLILTNTFKFSTKEDFLYYILFSIEQLGLDIDEINVFFSGKISNKNEEFKLISQYISNISFVRRSNKIKYPKEFNSLEDHEYFGLFSQILCE